MLGRMLVIGRFLTHYSHLRVLGKFHWSSDLWLPLDCLGQWWSRRNLPTDVNSSVISVEAFLLTSGCMVSDSVARYLSLGFHSQTKGHRQSWGQRKKPWDSNLMHNIQTLLSWNFSVQLGVFPILSLTNKQAANLQEMQRTLLLPYGHKNKDYE